MQWGYDSRTRDRQIGRGPPKAYQLRVFSCARPRPLATPVTYTLPNNPASKFHGFGLATSGPAMDGVVIAFEAGVSGAAAGISARAAEAAAAPKPEPSSRSPTPQSWPRLLRLCFR